jgi:hypothetical protein
MQSETGTLISRDTEAEKMPTIFDVLPSEVQTGCR